MKEGYNKSKRSWCLFVEGVVVLEGTLPKKKKAQDSLERNMIREYHRQTKEEVIEMSVEKRGRLIKHLSFAQSIKGGYWHE